MTLERNSPYPAGSTSSLVADILDALAMRPGSPGVEGLWQRMSQVKTTSLRSIVCAPLTLPHAHQAFDEVHRIGSVEVATSL